MFSVKELTHVIRGQNAVISKFGAFCPHFIQLPEACVALEPGGRVGPQGPHSHLLSSGLVPGYSTLPPPGPALGCPMAKATLFFFPVILLRCMTAWWCREGQHLQVIICQPILIMLIDTNSLKVMVHKGENELLGRQTSQQSYRNAPARWQGRHRSTHDPFVKMLGPDGL